MFYNIWRLWSYKVCRSVTQAVHWVPACRLLWLMVENHRLCHFVAKARACEQVVSSKVPALRLLLANCGFHDWSAHAQWFLPTSPRCHTYCGCIATYLDKLWHILYVGHICVTTCATYVAHMWHICGTTYVPHMCHILSHICVTTCTKYLSHFVNRGAEISVKLSNKSFEPLY